MENWVQEAAVTPEVGGTKGRWGSQIQKLIGGTPWGWSSDLWGWVGLSGVRGPLNTIQWGWFWACGKKPDADCCCRPRPKWRALFIWVMVQSGFQLEPFTDICPVIWDATGMCLPLSFVFISNNFIVFICKVRPIVFALPVLVVVFGKEKIKTLVQW